MVTIPRLYTPRLCLRGFTVADAGRVEELAGNALVIQAFRSPNPYAHGATAILIAEHEENAAAGRSWEFAVTLTGTRTPGREEDVTDTGHLIGTLRVALREEERGRCGDLGYWIGAPYWNKGFATEAAYAVMKFAFGQLECVRIRGRHFANNPASGRILQKLGMTRESALDDVQERDGAFLDVVGYSLLREEWLVSGSWRRRAGVRGLATGVPRAALAQHAEA
jgi:RimJ/RimL family protein N-acetyltransferase